MSSMGLREQLGGRSKDPDFVIDVPEGMVQARRHVGQHGCDAGESEDAVHAGASAGDVHQHEAPRL